MRALHCGDSGRSRQNCLSHELTRGQPGVGGHRRPDRRLARLPGRLARQRARPPRDRGLRRRRARRASSARRPTSTPRTTCAGGPASTSGPSSERTDAFEVIYASKAFPATAALRVMREEGLSVDVASGGELHVALRRGLRPSPHPPPRQQQDRGRAPLRVRGRRRPSDPRLLRRDRAGRPAARPPPAGADPGHARDQALHPRLRPDRTARLQVRLRARRPARRAGRRASAGVQAPRARRAARAHRLPDLRARALRQGDRGDRRLLRRRRTSSRELLNVGGGLGIAYLDADEPPSIEDYVDVKVRGVRARLRPGSADPGRAGPLAGRQRGDHRLPGRDRQGDSRASAPTSPSTAACRTTCARCSTAPATRR